MEITLASVQRDTFDIDFQKVFDFMKNEGELEDTVYDYSTEFGDNIPYYLEKVFGIKISMNSQNEFIFDSLYDGYYDWLEENKVKLELIEE